MKKNILFSLFVLFLNFSEVSAQSDPFVWNRLPTNSEIIKAKNELINHLNREISVNGKVVDNEKVKISPVIKFHNRKLAGKVEPQVISRAIVFVEVSGIGGKMQGEYNLFQNNQNGSFGFAKISNGFQQPTLKKQYENFINYLNDANNDAGLAPGFAPSLSGKAVSSEEDNFSNHNKENSTEDDDTILTIIIGALTAAIVIAARRRIKKRKNKKQGKKKDKSKKKKQDVEYILQLNREQFFLKQNKPQMLTANLWKITEKNKAVIRANFELQCSEKTLKIKPPQASGTLSSQLLLKDMPREKEFYINLTANADGHSFHKSIKIVSGSQKRIIVETAPDNTRSLRPNLEILLTCYAKVIDENGKVLPEETEKIKFKPQSNWIDLSDPALDGEWIAINMGASDPKANTAVSHPPKSVILSVIMDDVEEDEEILQNDLEIALLDCKIDTNIDLISLPVSDEQTEVTFIAYIEDCDGSTPWQFEINSQSIFCCGKRHPYTF